MAVYFLTFFCHRLFEALFVKKTQERKHPLFKYSHLSHKADFFKLAETEGNKTAKGTAKQKRTKPGVHSSWPPLNSVSEVSCFYLETIEQHGNHLLVLQAKIQAVSVARALDRTVKNSTETLRMFCSSEVSVFSSVCVKYFLFIWK